MLDFGQWVREERTRLRLTQTECARRAGMKTQQWNRMESIVKQPELHTVESVAKALGLQESEVRDAAGYRPRESPDENETEQEVLLIVQSVPREKQRALIEAFRAMANVVKTPAA